MGPPVELDLVKKEIKTKHRVTHNSMAVTLFAHLIMTPLKASKPKNS